MAVQTFRKILLWEILVPTNENDGTRIQTSKHQEWDAKVRSITGGLTISLPVKGQWLDKDDKLFAERMIPVRIACTKDQIETIADITAAHYSQRAVMYYQISSQVFIKSYQ